MIPQYSLAQVSDQEHYMLIISMSTTNVILLIRSLVSIFFFVLKIDIQIEIENYKNLVTLETFTTLVKM